MAICCDSVKLSCTLNLAMLESLNRNSSWPTFKNLTSSLIEKLTLNEPSSLNEKGTEPQQGQLGPTSLNSFWILTFTMLISWPSCIVQTVPTTPPAVLSLLTRMRSRGLLLRELSRYCFDLRSVLQILHFGQNPPYFSGEQASSPDKAPSRMYKEEESSKFTSQFRVEKLSYTNLLKDLCGTFYRTTCGWSIQFVALISSQSMLSADKVAKINNNKIGTFLRIMSIYYTEVEKNTCKLSTKIQTCPVSFRAHDDFFNSESGFNQKTILLECQL